MMDETVAAQRAEDGIVAFERAEDRVANDRGDHGRNERADVRVVAVMRKK